MAILPSYARRETQEQPTVKRNSNRRGLRAWTAGYLTVQGDAANTA